MTRGALLAGWLLFAFVACAGCGPRKAFLDSESYQVTGIIYDKVDHSVQLRHGQTVLYASCYMSKYSPLCNQLEVGKAYRFQRNGQILNPARAEQSLDFGRLVIEKEFRN